MKISDPVCGMKIDSDTAHAVEAFEGRHDHFCSAQCRDMFMRDPQRCDVQCARVLSGR